MLYAWAAVSAAVALAGYVWWSRWTPLVWALVALSWAALALSRGILARRGAARGGAPAKEGYVPQGIDFDRVDTKVAVLPTPGSQASVSPLAPFLDRAVDAAVPAVGAGQSVPHDADEVKGVLARVVNRINARSPGLDLVLVSFDNVKKTIDAYKNLRYEADMQVHTVRRGYSSRVSAAVDVSPGGKEYVRSLKVHNAAPDAAGPRAAADPHIASHERYATFEPAVLSYTPKL